MRGDVRLSRGGRVARHGEPLLRVVVGRVIRGVVRSDPSVHVVEIHISLDFPVCFFNFFIFI